MNAEPIPLGCSHSTFAIQAHTWGANALAIERGKKKPAHLWTRYQTERQSSDDVRRLPWQNADRAGIVNGVGGWRSFDLDGCLPGHAGAEAIWVILRMLGLSHDYAWLEVSAGGNGFHIWVLCDDPLPTGALTAKEGETGVYWGESLDGTFDHMELRWERNQTIVAASDDSSRWLNGKPSGPPACVSVGAILDAFRAVATPKDAAKPKRTVPPSRQTDDRGEMEMIRARFDMVAYASMKWPGEVRREGDEVRIRGNGGLLIKPGSRVWYRFDESVGGDCFDLVGRGLYSEQWDRKSSTMFPAAVREATAFAGVAQRSGPIGPPARPPLTVVRGDDTLPIGNNAESRPQRPLTDYGNAERLVDRFGDEIRYVVEQQSWIAWKGDRWEPDDTGDVIRCAKETIRTTYGEAADEADSSRREAIAKHAIRSEAAARIEAMVKLASTEKSIPLRLADCDADMWALNVLNGTIDLRTGELRPHRRDDFITKIAPVRYDPDATLPLFDAFLERILPDQETRAFVQRAIGYSLGGDTGEETLFFPYGPAATGKSTLLAAVGAALGDYAATADFETFLTRDFSTGGPRNDVARLAGKRFVVSLEVDQGKRLAEGLVKSFTGGDVISARFLHKESFEFKPEAKLWLAANHRPTVDENDEAMWRRIAQIPFGVQIPVEERDPRVKATLRDPEQAGAAVLAWAVRGCLAWQRERLRIPKEVKEATAAYRAEMDVLSSFIDDRCEVRKGAWVAAGALYGAYKKWCEEVGERHESQTAFGRRLADRSYHEGKQAGVRGRFGLTLSGQAETRPFEEDE